MFNGKSNCRQQSVPAISRILSQRCLI